MQNHVTWIYIYIYVSTFASLLIYINIRTYYYHTIYIYIYLYAQSSAPDKWFSYFMNFVCNFCFLGLTFNEELHIGKTIGSPTKPPCGVSPSPSQTCPCRDMSPRCREWILWSRWGGVVMVMVTAWSCFGPPKSKKPVLHIFFAWMQHSC